MKQHFKILPVLGVFFLFSCGTDTTNESAGEQAQTTETPVTEPIGQSGVADEVSNPNIVQVAARSKDHSTLVTAVKAAGLVDALSNAGPFTVFAPTNAAFEKVPKETLDDLLKPENKEKLSDLLGYHTYVGSIKADMIQDGMELDQVSLGKIKLSQKDGKTFVNGTAEIVGSVSTSNGVIHIINEVLMPPKP